MNNHYDSLVGLVIDDDSVKNKLRKIIAQQEFQKKNHQKYSCLTLHENEIIKQIAIGYNNPQLSKF
jgi:FixJ family two-component response regulator